MKPIIKYNKDFISSEKYSKEIIGLTFKKVEKILVKNRIQFRILQEDDEVYLVTCDYIPTRINIKIKNGVITSSTLG